MLGGDSWDLGSANVFGLATIAIFDMLGKRFTNLQIGFAIGSLSHFFPIYTRSAPPGPSMNEKRNYLAIGK